MRAGFHAFRSVIPLARSKVRHSGQVTSLGFEVRSPTAASTEQSAESSGVSPCSSNRFKTSSRSGCV